MINEFIRGHVAKRRELPVGIHKGAVDQTRHIVDFPVMMRLSLEQFSLAPAVAVKLVVSGRKEGLRTWP